MTEKQKSAGVLDKGVASEDKSYLANTSRSFNPIFVDARGSDVSHDQLSCLSISPPNHEDNDNVHGTDPEVGKQIDAGGTSDNELGERSSFDDMLDKGAQIIESDDETTNFSSDGLHDTVFPYFFDQKISYETGDTWRIYGLLGSVARIEDENSTVCLLAGELGAECVAGHCQGKLGVLKVYSQTEGTPMSRHPDHVRREIKALTQLSIAKEVKKRSFPAPALLHVNKLKQKQSEENVWIKGGYLCLIMMELMPGRPLDEVCRNFDSAKKKVVKEKFVENLKLLRYAGVAPKSCSLAGLVWDEKNQECNFIDMADAHSWTSDYYEANGIQPEIRKSEIRHWGFRDW